jgi:hypothetical protein
MTQCMRKRQKGRICCEIRVVPYDDSVGFCDVVVQKLLEVYAVPLSEESVGMAQRHLSVRVLLALGLSAGQRTSRSTSRDDPGHRWALGVISLGLRAEGNLPVLAVSVNVWSSCLVIVA